MSFTKYLISAAALASAVSAQSSSNICSQATATVQNGGDASAIATACSTFSGSIAVATQASGDIDFSGIKQISGSLSAVGAVNVSSITSSSLSSIGQALDLEGLTAISALSFPNLTSVGSLTFLTIGPNLQQLTSWTQGLRNVGALNIQDTFLGNLNGINLTSAQSITIANNQYLTNIDIPLTSLSGALTLNANAAGRTVATFNNLTSVGSIAISNCSTIGLAALTNATGSVAINSNNFANLTLPNFASSNGLTINNNNQMASLDLPAYSQDSGALSIQNNTDLTGTISLPALVRVSGAANIVGAYSNISTPALNTVLGAVVLQSTQDISSVCAAYQNIQGSSSIIQGTITCNSGSGKSSTGTSGSSTTSSGASSASSTPKSAAVSNAGMSTFTLLGALGAMFAMMA